MAVGVDLELDLTNAVMRSAFSSRLSDWKRDTFLLNERYVPPFAASVDGR